MVKNEPYYHAYAWGLPALLLIIVTGTGALGDAGNWCWIKRSHMAARMLCYYVPLIIIMIFNALEYFLIGTSLKNQGASQQQAIMKRLRLYIVVFVFCRFWSVLNRVTEAINGDHGIFAFMLMHSLFSPLQGFANSIVYGLNKKILRTYRATGWCNFLPCCRTSRFTSASASSIQLDD